MRVERLLSTVTIRCPWFVANCKSPGVSSGARYGGAVPVVAAAVCPHPPLIVPEIAAGAAPDLADLRAACHAAAADLLAASPATVVVVGSGADDQTIAPGGYDTFARFGVPVPVRLGRAPAQSHFLPLSVLVGGWLLQRAAAPVVVAQVVGGDTSTARCADLGRRLAERDDPIALLVMGDGSAYRDKESPGYDDARAQAYDDGVAAALGDADAAALRGLDPALSAELSAAGRAPWQVLAGAVQAAGRRWRGQLSYYAAPYGVAYFVATWRPA